jgi:hypothetical protein
MSPCHGVPVELVVSDGLPFGVIDRDFPLPLGPLVAYSGLMVNLIGQ